MAARAALACLLLAVAPLHPFAQEQLQFFAAFTDAAGQPVTSVTPADLDVREDGITATVLAVEKVDWPVRVELLLDNGAGLAPEDLIHLRNGVRAFTEALPDGVEAAVFTMAPQPRTIVRATTDRQQLNGASGLLTTDAGAGRFIEALMESADRINKSHGDKDGGRYFPVVVAFGTTSAGGRVPVDRDIQQMMERFATHAATVHVVMLSSTARTLTGGANQTHVGTAVADLTGGAYENISAPSRIATLLPELASRVAASHERQMRQVRITVRRPANATGPLGQVTVRARNVARSQLSLDGHLP